MVDIKRVVLYYKISIQKKCCFSRWCFLCLFLYWLCH